MAISWTLACWWGGILCSKITLGQCIEVSFRGRCWDGLAEGFCVGPPVWGQWSQWPGACTDVVLGGRWGSSIVQWYSQQLSCCIFCTCTHRTFYCREWGSLGTLFFSSFFFLMLVSSNCLFAVLLILCFFSSWKCSARFSDSSDLAMPFIKPLLLYNVSVEHSVKGRTNTLPELPSGLQHKWRNNPPRVAYSWWLHEGERCLWVTPRYFFVASLAFAWNKAGQLERTFTESPLLGPKGEGVPLLCHLWGMIVALHLEGSKICFLSFCSIYDGPFLRPLERQWLEFEGFLGAHRACCCTDLGLSISLWWSSSAKRR